MGSSGQTVEVDPRYLHKIVNLYSAEEITTGKIRGIYFHDGKPYVITSCLFSGESGCTKLWATELIPLQQWKGDRYTYNEKSRLTTRDRGERFYTGVCVKYDGTSFVMGSGRIELVKGERDPRFDQPEQLGLFV
jgi:hypothetical protein